MKRVFVGGVVFLATAIFLYFFFKSSLNTSPRTAVPTRGEVGEIPAAEVIAENLDTPWGIAFLPDNSILVTERQGRVRLISSSGKLQSDPVAVLGSSKESGEGGLLGIAIHPDFSSNNFVYFYYTYSSRGNGTFNRVVRMEYKNGRLEGERIIVDEIPGRVNHNGGRMKFGSDGYLYITTGDAQEPSQSQDINSLAGKILRVTDEGEIVPSNPFGNPVYSYGHRNPQGLAWDSTGALWSTEHGRSGIYSGFDELNLIQRGGNYGWPVIQGDETKSGMITPVENSGASTTWAPSGADFTGSSLFFGGLRGEALYEAVIQDNRVKELREHFKGKYGRIRDVVLGPDKMLYITTSNRDGRGSPESTDDRIIRIDPRKL